MLSVLFSIINDKYDEGFSNKFYIFKGAITYLTNFPFIYYGYGYILKRTLILRLNENKISMHDWILDNLVKWPEKQTFNVK